MDIKDFEISDFMQINQKVNKLGVKSSALDQVCKLIYKKHIENGNVKFDDLNIEQKVLNSNSSLIYQDIGSLLSYVAHSVENPINFVKNIPNVRTLKSNDLV